LEHVERKVTNDKNYSRKWKLKDAQKMFIQLSIGDCKSLDVEVHYQNSTKLVHSQKLSIIFLTNWSISKNFEILKCTKMWTIKKFRVKMSNS